MTSSRPRIAALALLLPLAAAVAGGAGCADDKNETAPPADGGRGGDSAAVVLQDIVDTATAAGSFSTLVAAVGAADLVSTLKSPGPFTVFAPTDAAFAKLPAGTVDNLLKPENKAQLAAVLTYHVLPRKVMAAEVVATPSLTTVQGAALAVTVAGAQVKVNDAQVTQTDIGCSNGVIHVIDTVLLPPAR